MTLITKGSGHMEQATFTQMHSGDSISQSPSFLCCIAVTIAQGIYNAHSSASLLNRRTVLVASTETNKPTTVKAEIPADGTQTEVNRDVNMHEREYDTTRILIG